MTQHLRIDRSSSGNEAESAHAQIGESKYRYTAQCEQSDAALDKLKERQDKNIETDVARVERIGQREILLPNQAQQPVPVAMEDKTKEQGGSRRRQDEEPVEAVRLGLRRGPALAAGRAAGENQAAKIGMSRQDPKVEQHVGEYGHEGDCEHCQLGRAQPPEGIFVTERPE